MTNKRSIVSLINDTNGSNFDDIEFIFRWAIIGRSAFFSFSPVSNAFGSFASESDTFPADIVDVVEILSLKLN